MKRVLIISPHFPPVNAPDLHRVRLALPYFRSLGWEATVLAVAPETIEGATLEPSLEQSYPASIRVVRVRGIPVRYTRPFGFGSLWWRVGHALRRAGDRLLATERFDLVFFSTTQFPAFTLGPRWLARFGVPYVLDYQDPWLNDHYAKTGARPPGGPLRFLVAQLNARRHERKAVLGASALITVSPTYGPQLRERHPALCSKPIHHLPFGAAAGDFAFARTHSPAVPLVRAGPGVCTVVYAGRCVPGMAPALTLLFQALRVHLAKPGAARFHFHFIGTNYASAAQARPMVLPLAEREGVDAYVSEHTQRVPYFDALHYLATADAILVLGSDDPGYNASKLYPCLFAARPLLCIAHPLSPIFHTASQYTPGSTFAAPDESGAGLKRLAANWLGGEGFHQLPNINTLSLASHSAEVMTRHMVEIFDHALIPAANSSP
ncbi:MAG: hypothetical protein NTU80_00270 [Verrucomicrobia bacterium]|nr:hypothetical protein [Verrucomicrobiota bacterium]